MDDKSYCKLYIDFEGDDNEFLKIIALHLGDKFLRRYDDFFNDNAVIYTLSNDNHCIEKKSDSIEGFLFFAKLVELEKKESLSHESFIDLISGILKMFWSSGIEAVAAGFQKELPDHGGYFGKIISHKK